MGPNSSEEERQWSGYSSSGRFLADHGSQAPGSHPSCHQDAQEEGQLCQGGGEGGAQEEICQLNWLLQKWKPKMAMGKDTSSGKTVQTKGKRGAKGKQEEMANQRLKKTYLQKMERRKMASGVTEEKEAELD